MCSWVSSTWRKLHQPRVYLTVEPILLLFSFASFLSYTVFQELLHHLICQHTPNCSTTRIESDNVWNGTTVPGGVRGGGDGRCEIPGPIEQRVQTETSHWILYINIASGVPSILVSIFYGAVSDVKGRRLFMILPALGMIVNQAVVLCVVFLPNILPLPFLLLGSLVSGVSGSFSVFNFAVYSYASDISATSKRTVQIGILESMTFLGATLSYLIGGRWVNNIYFTAPLFCIIAIDIVIVVYVIVALPESVKMIQGGTDGVNIDSSSRQRYQSSGQHIQRQPEDDNHTSLTCNLLKSSFTKLASFLKLLFTSWTLTLLLGMFFVVEINFLGITDTVILFALGEPLCWDTDLIGYFLAAKVFMNGVATLLLLPLLSLLRFSDVWLVVVGLVSGGLGLLLLGSSTHTWMMFIVPVVSTVRGWVVPIIRSMLSKSTPVDMQGVLFSGVGVVEAACTLFASVIYNSLYPLTRTVTPGLIFYIMAAALLIPLALVGILELRRRRVCRSNDDGRESDPLLGSLHRDE